MVRYRKKEFKKILHISPAEYKADSWGKLHFGDSTDYIERGWHRVLTYAGEAFRRESYLKTALSFFNSALKRKSGSWKAFFFRALAHSDNFNREDARSDLKQADKLSRMVIPVDEIERILFNGSR